MSLDVYLHAIRRTEVFSANITHNMQAMAEEAGIQKALWRPEEVGITSAGRLIEPLRAAIKAMEEEPDRFKKHNPENGWGSYDVFLPWLKEYLAACEANPDAEIEVSR